MRSAIHRIDHDRQALARGLSVTLTKAGRSAYVHAVSALRLGVPLEQAVRVATEAARPAIARSIIRATLQGVRRTALEAQYATGTVVTLSRDKDDDDKRILALLLLLGWTEEDLRPIAARARQQADGYTVRMAAPLLRRLDATRRDWAVKARASQRAAETVPQAFPTGYGVDVAVSFRQKTADLREVWRKAGFGFDEPWAPTTWADTIATRAHEDGRGIAYRAPAIREALWGFRYDATLDAKTTAMCRALHNWRAPKDDPAIERFRPKNHWNCRSALVEVWQSGALNVPTATQPNVTSEQWAEFYEIKRKYLAGLP